MKNGMVFVLLGCAASMACACASGDDGTQDDEARTDCSTHEMRPNRYRLFEIVEELRGLTEGAADPEGRSIYVVPNHWSQFWATPQAGFLAAQDEMGFSGEFKPPCESSDTTCVQDQVNLLGELTDGSAENGEADAIAVSCKSAEAMGPPIQAASDRLPIITFDADVSNPTSTGRRLYLGALNLPAGQTAGETMLELVNEGGAVYLYGQTFATTNLLERAAGVFGACLETQFASAAEFESSEYCRELSTRHVCEAECTGVHGNTKVIASSYADQFNADSAWKDAHPDASAEDYLAYLLDGLLSGDEIPAGLMSLQGVPGPIVGKAIADHYLEGRVRFVAWDLGAEIQAGLESGSVDATMVQNAYFYGYLSAHIAYAMAAADEATVTDVLDDYFASGTDDKLLDTGVTIVTAENLPFYLEYQRECLGVSTG